MNVAMSVGLAMAAILGAYLFVLWFASAGVIENHEDRIAGMEKWRAETFGGPDAEHAAELEREAKTDEIPVAPATVPDGMPLAVQSVLIEQRPSPVPREAEMIERTVNIGGTLQTFRIPAREDT